MSFKAEIEAALAQSGHREITEALLSAVEKEFPALSYRDLLVGVISAHATLAVVDALEARDR